MKFNLEKSTIKSTDKLKIAICTYLIFCLSKPKNVKYLTINELPLSIRWFSESFEFNQIRKIVNDLLHEKSFVYPNSETLTDLDYLKMIQDKYFETKPVLPKLTQFGRHTMTIIYRFGSWSNALRCALGVEPKDFEARGRSTEKKSAKIKKVVFKNQELIVQYVKEVTAQGAKESKSRLI